jgi:hypothetical protein
MSATLLPIMSFDQAAFISILFRLWVVASEFLTAGVSGMLLLRAKDSGTHHG